MRAEILPPVGAPHCRTGSLCSLDVSITRLLDLMEVDKDEALSQSQSGENFSTKLLYEGGCLGLPTAHFSLPAPQVLALGCRTPSQLPLPGCS